MKNFLKNKSVGYFIGLGVAVFSLIVTIIFLTTSTGNLGNKADGIVASTIGVFLVAGFITQCIALLLPQYRFIQVLATIMFGFAFYKDVILIADFIAGVANNVEYNGGNTPLNFFYFISIFVIVIACVVVAFKGFYKSEDDAKAELKKPLKGDVKGIVKVAASSVVFAAVVISSALITKDLKAKSAGAGSEEEESTTLITDEIKTIADNYEYDFDPKSVVIKEEETYDYNNADLKALTLTSTRDDHHLIYYFEGSYAEGYQGDYSETYGEIYLWDDGIYIGQIANTEFRGYWYNSSLANGKDENGNDIIDCVNMVSNVSKYESIISEKAGTGFYERQVYAYLGFSWGTRSMILSGYLWYPDVAIVIDTGTIGTEFKVGDSFAPYVVDRVLKSLNYGAILKQGNVSWSCDVSKAINSSKVFKSAGDYTLTAKWGSFETSIDVTVTED